VSCTDVPAQNPEHARTKNKGLRHWAGLSKPWMEIMAAVISLYALVIVAVPHKGLADLRASLQIQATALSASRDKQRKVEGEIERAQTALDVARAAFQGDLAALRTAEQELDALNKQASLAEQRSTGLSREFTQVSTRIQQSKLRIEQFYAEAKSLEAARHVSTAKLLTIQMMLVFNGLYWEAELNKLKTPVPPGLLTAAVRDMVRATRQDLTTVFGASQQQAFAAAADRASAALERATRQAEELRMSSYLSEHDLTEEMKRSGILAPVHAQNQAREKIRAILRKALSNAMRDCFSAVLTPAELTLVFGPPPEPT
jgi:hypothetical protein